MRNITNTSTVQQGFDADAMVDYLTEAVDWIDQGVSTARRGECLFDKTAAVELGLVLADHWMKAERNFITWEELDSRATKSWALRLKEGRKAGTDNSRGTRDVPPASANNVRIDSTKTLLTKLVRASRSILSGFGSSRERAEAWRDLAVASLPDLYGKSCATTPSVKTQSRCKVTLDSECQGEFSFV